MVMQREINHLHVLSAPSSHSLSTPSAGSGDLLTLRMRTCKHEIIVAPSADRAQDFTLVVVQSVPQSTPAS